MLQGGPRSQEEGELEARQGTALVLDGSNKGIPPESTSPGELGGACRGVREAPLGLQGTLFPPASPGLPCAAERAAAHTGKEPMLNHLCWDCLCVCS